MSFTLFQDIFGAATDTTASTLEWVMAELIRDPQAMSRATCEIRQKLGQGRVTITNADLGDLPYLRMVIKETLSPRFTSNSSVYSSCQPRKLLDHGLQRTQGFLCLHQRLQPSQLRGAQNIGARPTSSGQKVWEQHNELQVNRLLVHPIWSWTQAMSRSFVRDHNHGAHTGEPPVPLRLGASWWRRPEGPRHEWGVRAHYTQEIQSLYVASLAFASLSGTRLM